MAKSKILLWIYFILSSIFMFTLACQSFLSRREEPLKPVEPWSTFNASSFEKKIAENCVCGVSPRKSYRISGGENADKNEFPFQAAIVYRNTRIPFCSGTLINNQFVLSASHCLLSLPRILTTTSDDFLIENDFQVLLNAHKLKTLNEQTTVELYRRLVAKSWDLDPEDAEADFEEGTLRIDIKKKIYHPGFVTEYRKLGFDFDVALLELETPVNLTLGRNSPIPICLPTTNELETYQDELATTIGWGRTNFRDLSSGSPTLQKIQIPVYSVEECSRISGLQVSTRFICAGHQTKKKDIGKSDSGGPLLVLRSGQFIQIGITSWGAGEQDGHVASAFTRVSEYLPWIYYHINESSNDHQDVDINWCDYKKMNYEQQNEQVFTSTDLADESTEATTFESATEESF